MSHTLLDLLHRCLDLVHFNEELGQCGPDLHDLKRDLSEAITAFEAPRRDDPARRKRSQNADAQGDKPSSLGW